MITEDLINLQRLLEQQEELKEKCFQIIERVLPKLNEVYVTYRSIQRKYDSPHYHERFRIKPSDIVNIKYNDNGTFDITLAGLDFDEFGYETIQFSPDVFTQQLLYKEFEEELSRENEDKKNSERSRLLKLIEDAEYQLEILDKGGII